jgi:hypothetical protein
MFEAPKIEQSDGIASESAETGKKAPLSGKERAARYRAKRREEAEKLLQTAERNLQRPITSAEDAAKKLLQEDATKDEKIRTLMRKQKQDRDKRRTLRQALKEEKKSELSQLEAESMFDSPKEIKKDPDVLKILSVARGIKHPQVAQTVMNFTRIAASVLNLPENEYLWINGVARTLEARAAKVSLSPLPVETGVTVIGEAIYKPDLLSLYDALFSWRDVDIKGRGKVRLSFKEFLEYRFRAKSDLWFLAVDICGRTLVESTHREMVEFFVKKDPTLIPVDYSSEDIKRALTKTDSMKNRLLLFPRGMMKSTTNICDMCQWIIWAQGDIRALVCTATYPLAVAFVKELKDYFVVRNAYEPSLFNMLFAEFTISPAEKGSKDSFKSPMSRLGTKEDNFFATAIDADSTGFHVDLLLIDDGCSVVNSATPELREKVISRFDMISELLDRPFGFTLVIGTRYHGEPTPDLYGEIIKRNDATGGEEWKILIKGAWTVHPDAKNKNIYDLTGEDVDLLYALEADGSEGRGSFRVLRKKLGNPGGPLKTFLNQQLNECTPDEDEDLKVCFDESVIRAHSRPFDSFPKTDITVVGGIDTAFSVSRYADFSVGLIGLIFKNEYDEPSIVFVDGFCDRLRPSELAIEIVKLISRWPGIQSFAIEKSNGWQLLAEAIQRQAMLRAVLLPQIYWQPTAGGGTAGKNAKYERGKKMELALSSHRLWFSTGLPIYDQLLEQFTNFTGKKSTQNRKDDAVDAASICCRYLPSVFESSKDMEAAREAARDAELRAFQYNQIFGQGGATRPNPNPESESNTYQLDKTNPIGRALSPLARSSAKKQISFADLIRKTN